MGMTPKQRAAGKKDTFEEWRKSEARSHVDKFRTPPPTEKFRKGWDRIFGKNKIRNRKKSGN
tara:strand:- start:718 stop:903 length:186 start_codon:yes stop_codon:yes gene_type:complete